jgi:hypothetical protein
MKLRAISRANFRRGSRALGLLFRSEGSRGSGSTALSRLSHKCPVQNRIKITSMITLTPLMGTKPHFLLCGQIGRLPTSATRTNTASTAIRNIAFLLFFNCPDLGCVSGTTEGRTSLRSRLTSRFRAADKSPGTGFHSSLKQSRRPFLAFAPSYVAAPIAHFISLKVGDLIEAL